MEKAVLYAGPIPLITMPQCRAAHVHHQILNAHSLLLRCDRTLNTERLDCVRINVTATRICVAIRNIKQRPGLLMQMK